MLILLCLTQDHVTDFRDQKNLLKKAWATRMSIIMLNILRKRNHTRRILHLSNLLKKLVDLKPQANPLLLDNFIVLSKPTD